MLLVYAWKKARHILKCNKRNIEAIAKTHKTRCLYRGVNIQNAREKSWLIRHNADRITAEPSETDHDIRCILFLNFEKIPVIQYRVENVADIIWLARGFGHDR